MSRTSDEIRQLLAVKFQRESKRLASWGTKTDEKAAVSFAAAVTEFVRALMCESRYKELKRLEKEVDLQESTVYFPKKYVIERKRVLKTMTRAIQEFAAKKESERPKGFKKHKHKHHHHHGHNRSSHHRRH